MGNNIFGKYTSLCCGFYTLNERPIIPFNFVQYVFGKVMECRLMILTMSEEQINLV